MAGYGSSFWSDRTASTRRRSYPAFRGQHAADAVVIGGGLTGATAAYVFAQAGLDVVLLEGGRLASAGTSGSLGAIVPQPDAWFRSVEAVTGLRTARAAWQVANRSALDLGSALNKLRIKCDLEEQPVIVNARTPTEVERLRREQSARKAAGLDAPWLSGAAAVAEIGSESLGALRLAKGFVFDPVRAALGLTAAAEGKGARIFERSAVTRTRFTRKHADVMVGSAGSIRTRLVFVATGGPGRLFSQLRRHVHEQTGFVVATEPLSAAMRKEAGRQRTVVTEAGETRTWLRWLPENRALFAGGISEPVGTRQRANALVVHTADQMYELSVRYPAISGLPAKWGWDVPVISTADGLPWVGGHRNYPFHFFAIAFGWHGDSYAWFAAKAALRAFNGETKTEDRALGFLR